MNQEINNRWIKFNEQFEGRVHWMYCDIKGLITTGVGNLIDPMSLALNLPWLKSDNTSATKQEIIDEWLRIKDDAIHLAKTGHKAVHYTLHLTDEAIDNLVLTRLQLNFKILRNKFTDIETWPWQAQLAVLSMSWALGPKFWLRWPMLTKALEEHDWNRASLECAINSAGNPGVKPRNTANMQLFRDAAAT